MKLQLKMSEIFLEQEKKQTKPQLKTETFFQTEKKENKAIKE